jgi:hypothetical protein
MLCTAASSTVLLICSCVQVKYCGQHWVWRRLVLHIPLAQSKQSLAPCNAFTLRMLVHCTSPCATAITYLALRLFSHTLSSMYVLYDAMYSIVMRYVWLLLHMCRRKPRTVQQALMQLRASLRAQHRHLRMLGTRKFIHLNICTAHTLEVLHCAFDATFESTSWSTAKRTESQFSQDAVLLAAARHSVRYDYSQALLLYMLCTVLLLSTTLTVDVCFVYPCVLSYVLCYMACAVEGRHLRRHSHMYLHHWLRSTRYRVITASNTTLRVRSYQCY